MQPNSTPLQVGEPRFAKRDFAKRVRGTLLPAALTPMTGDGILDEASLERYAAKLAAQEIGGIAVSVHTGRGPYLGRGPRRRVRRVWRDATTLPLIVGVSVPVGAAPGGFAEYRDLLRRDAAEAASAGADALLVQPAPALQALPDYEASVLALHEAVAEESGLDVLAFHLYERGGGGRYRLGLISRLLELPCVIGIKVASLDRAVECQEICTLTRASGKLCITGEDRMFGPSFMWGADTALVGIAAVRTELSAALVTSWREQGAAAFLRASAAVDAFAAATFREPMDGYVQRLLWVAATDGFIPASSAFDPFGPQLVPQDKAALLSFLAEGGPAGHDEP